MGGVLGLVLLLLATGYFLFLRTDYVVLAQGLRPTDASAIVAELDKRGVAYRLRDGGATILVPEGQADATRVAIAGSDAAARGQIGFELFNKSDMGLTNFAQKINYQRALQGELVRTITAMDGVETARVHLALPEKALFRGDRVDPKAAVTVTMKPGQTADPARVSGIQQLVAAAVPDLPESKVVVLDAAGHVISPAPAIEGGAGLERPADIEERGAIENYYRARARGAVERQMPGVRFALRVLLLPNGPAGSDPATAPAAGWTPSGEGAARNFRMRILFISEAPINSEDQQVARNAIVQATGLDDQAGDSLSFETGPIDRSLSSPPIAQPSHAAAGAPAAAAPLPAQGFGFAWPPVWLWLVAGVAIAAMLVWRFRAPGSRMSGEEQEAFAQRLRRQLNMTEEAGDAAA
ncbi:MAG: flagellar M-ring protein FliF [Sphingomonas sp.]|uniref:flagellar basal-body MS-ring/collar protein FliF n=1 Tax=Sphingomonas sp. TaxID=28214 RepID=UPI0025DB1E80|nr:flagellar basal-body MS-ring/collar protein FliF [Sphingomonas sp.]MBQ1496692.1 flagellar M-ring protein FliF [Sphingomonas sp.]